ncbi:MAG: hypothetical protein KBE73_06970 [Fusobacteriaceae bacterium]|nr:hypothetical protein [Fusobacteriaceae bacterium]MBP6323158.1 hypothetical protein [Fusobacteriaceae bacterium]MBP9510840.1 hypothetical protein [Fusobacteriaceae bacterium]
MKKLVVALFLVALSTIALGIDSHLRFGAITNAEKYNGEDEFSNYSPAFGLEVTQSLFLFDVGGGIQYNDKVEGTDVATTPVYGLVRWNIIPIAIKPYLVAKAGKSIYSRNSVNGSDPEGNNFYGAGAGMNVRNLQLELFYSITELDDTDGRRDDEMEQVTLMAGYKIF